MAAHNGTLTNTIQTKWDMDVLEGRYASGVVLNRVLNKTEIIKSKGDKVSINIAPKLTIGTVTAATGAFTASSSVTTIVNISANVWEYIAEQITDQGRIQSFWTAENLFPKASGEAWGEKFDEVLCGLYTGVADGNTINESVAQDFGKDPARAAILKLSDKNVPLVNLSWIMAPIGIYGGWMNDPELTQANTMGLPKNVHTTGFVTPIMGHPAYQTTKVATSGDTRKCLLLHKEALGIVMQKNNEFKLVDNSPANYIAHTAFCWSLYGYNTVRSDHFVVVNTKAS